MDWAMKTKGYNQRRACVLAGIDPRVYRRASKRSADTELRIRMKELASERRRFGYRRLHMLLKREGWHVNWKKLYRLYCEEGLTVRKRGGRKRAVGTWTPMAIPQGPNQRWSLDFVRRRSFWESVSVFTTEALVRFLFELKRPRLGAATGVFGLSLF